MCTIQIDANFPGGNVQIDDIVGDEVWFQPDLRYTQGHWFYWAFRVRGGAGHRLRFHLTSLNCLTHRGPAMSVDAGMTWDWLPHDQFDSEAGTFNLTVPAGAEEVRLSIAMPYTLEHWRRALPRWLESGRAHELVLCPTRAGLDVPMLVVGDMSASRGAVPYRVVISARRHACEMMTNYVIEGLLDAWLDAASPAAEWLLEHAELRVVPFVDLDGVEAGDQGKNRRPHDHNRDYIEQAIYPETRALMQQVPKWGPTDVWLDLHCPWIKNNYNEAIYMVGSANPRAWQAQQSFGEVLEQSVCGALPYHADDNLPFGEAWNTGEAVKQGYRTGSNWGESLPGCRLSTSFEFPYALVRGKTVTQANARQFGGYLMAALADWLKTDPPRLHDDR